MFLSSSEHGNQQNPPLLKSHIELLKQFKGSRTFTNFIEPLLPKNRNEQPCVHVKVMYGSGQSFSFCSALKNTAVLTWV